MTSEHATGTHWRGGGGSSERDEIAWEYKFARHESAEDFCRLKARRCTAMDWIFIPAYSFAIP